MARGDSGRAVGTGDLKLASCRDPPLQSAGAHSAADEGFAKGGMKPMAAAKIIYPKFMSLLLMISPSPDASAVLSAHALLAARKERIWSTAAHHKQLLSTTETACPHCPPKQGTGNLHTLLLLEHFLMQSISPQAPS